MKKLLVLFAALGLLVSCQLIHQTFDSPDECAAWYLDEIYDAVQDKDAEKVQSLADDSNEWYEGLDKAEQKEADNGSAKWAIDNPEKMAAIITYANVNDIDL